MPFEEVPHIVSARHVGGLRLHLKFRDGVQGVVDLRTHLRTFSGVLAVLKDPAFVARVRVVGGTIWWPGDIDLDPIVLHCAVRGVPIPTYD